MNMDSFYMRRCIQLARSGAGYTAPNPMVGAILVYENRIIGEGYHQQYGYAHAEVNCIKDAEQRQEGIIEKSTLYVSLEPCAHFGKTPPCSNLIMQKKIPRVVVGCRDPFAEVDGKGIEKLKSAGIIVNTGIEETACKDLNKRFLTFHKLSRPYIILKWAESSDGKIGGRDKQRIYITNQITNRLVHKWRAEEAAILVGTNTAMNDNPSLTTRMWKGNSPLRLVLDLNLKLPKHLIVFDGNTKTIVFNYLKQEETGELMYYKLNNNESLVMQILTALFRMNIQSLIVEGGFEMLQSFIDEDCWDEARIIVNTNLLIGQGTNAPLLYHAKEMEKLSLLSDNVHIYKPLSLNLS